MKDLLISPDIYAKKLVLVITSCITEEQWLNAENMYNNFVKYCKDINHRYKDYVSSNIGETLDNQILIINKR